MKLRIKMNAFLILCTMFHGIINPTFFTNTCKPVPLIPRNILFGNPEKSRAHISPDGTKLAYLAPRDGVLNVWIKSIGKHDDQPITAEKKRGIRSYNWAQNNRYILYAQDKDGDEDYHIIRTDISTHHNKDLTPFKNVRASVIDSDKHFPDEMLITMNKENPQFMDVYRLNVVSGELTMIAKNPGTIFSWLADRHFVVRAATSITPDGKKEVLVRDNQDAPWKTVLTWNFEDAMTGQLAGFSADGTSLFLLDSTGRNSTALIKFNIATGSKTVIAADPIYDITMAYFDNETYEPTMVMYLKERPIWHALDPKLSKDLKKIQSSTKSDLVSINRSSDQNKWVVAFSKDTDSGSYYFYDRITKQKPTFLFHTKGELQQYTLARTKPISFTARDGLTIHGYLTLPSFTKAKKLPLVLNVHGGPWSRDAGGFDTQAQWLANRGYACLQVNYRGSTGYGKEFLNAGNREWARNMQHDLTDAVQWAIKKCIADPNKVAIYGGSYGGYAALIGASFTPDLYCCAVDIVGPVNLVTLLKAIPPYWTAEKNSTNLRVGDPDKDVEFLTSRSPISRINQIKIPILIAQGANDPRVKQAEAEQIVAALKAKNLPYEYMLFPDEGHGFVRPENRIKFYTAAEKFLAKHLGGRYEV